MQAHMPNECPFKLSECIKRDTNSDKKMGDVSEPPGPRGPPIVGQAFNLDTDYMHIQFMEWQKRFGDMFMFKVFGKHYLVISHPNILRKMFITCERADMFNDRPASFMGKYVIERTKDIVFRKCDDNQQTLKMATLNYIETLLKEEKWFYEHVNEECAEVVNKLERLKDSLIDMGGILDKFSAKVIGLLISGRRIKEGDEEFKSLCGFMAGGNELGKVKNQTILTKLPGVRKIPGHLKDTFDAVCEQKDKLKQYFITENKSERGLVARLKQLATTVADDSGESWLDVDFIMGVIMDLTAAAIVPLQNTLSVLSLVLAHHPGVQDRIRAEMKRSPRVTVDEMSQMQYTAATMLELKRYHTPLPISARHCNRSGSAKFETYNIPKNTEIFSNLFGIHHDERFWTNPWEFQPERFLSEEGTLVKDDHPNMTNLTVTGVGPRRCVGSKFTENVTFLIAASILKKFKIESSETNPLPSCDPRKFLPGVVTRAPDFKCNVTNVDCD